MGEEISEKNKQEGGEIGRGKNKNEKTFVFFNNRTILYTLGL